MSSRGCFPLPYGRKHSGGHSGTLSFLGQANTRGSEKRTAMTQRLHQLLPALACVRPRNRRGETRPPPLLLPLPAAATTVQGQGAHAVPLVCLDVNFLPHPFVAIITVAVTTTAAAAMTSGDLGFHQSSVGLLRSSQKTRSDGGDVFELFIFDGAGSQHLENKIKN